LIHLIRIGDLWAIVRIIRHPIVIRIQRAAGDKEWVAGQCELRMIHCAGIGQ